MSLNANQANDVCESYLAYLYAQTQPTISSTPSQKILSETNGAILYPAITQCLTSLHLTEQDILVDLGSASGRIVLQAFLTTDIKEAWGMEIVPSLHQQALAVSQIVKKDLPEFFINRQLKFLQASFLETPLAPATVAIINATCFGLDILHPLGKVIENTPSIHTVVTLRPLLNLRRLKVRKVFFCGVFLGNSARLFISLKSKSGIEREMARATCSLISPR
ncbi:MAG: hypothetical protein QM752_08255 [Gammaproteobacteria bacterium]